MDSLFTQHEVPEAEGRNDEEEERREDNDSGTAFLGELEMRSRGGMQHYPDPGSGQRERSSRLRYQDWHTPNNEHKARDILADGDMHYLPKDNEQPMLHGIETGTSALAVCDNFDLGAPCVLQEFVLSSLFAVSFVSSSSCGLSMTEVLLIILLCVNRLLLMKRQTHKEKCRAQRDSILPTW